MEKIKKEWNIASEEDLLLEHVETLDLIEAMTNYIKRQTEKERLKAVSKRKEVVFERSKFVSFIVEIGYMDNVKHLLEQHEIGYDIESL